MPKAIRVKTPDPVVSNDAPFAEDALGRETTAEVLTQFVSRIEDPFVLALNAPWGSGKTTFVRMWRQSLENASFQTLYFNAWETDFSSNPFVSLVGELAAAIEDMSGGKPTRKHLERAKKIAVSISKRAVPVAVRIGTAGAVDLDKEIEKELSALAGDIAKDQIQSYASTKAAIRDFRDALQDLVSSLAGNRPLVFFIDELDRCRPSYAIELLEQAKHLFSVPGIVFVLSLDKNQLIHSIRAVYGSEFDAGGYLRRFIDIDFALPDPEPGNYTAHLFDRLGVTKHFEGRPPQHRRDEHDIVRSLMQDLVEITGLSLREQMQCVSRLLIVLNTIPDNHKLFDFELVTMTILREWRPDLYSRFAAGIIGDREVVDELRTLPGGPQFLAEHRGCLVQAALAAGADELSETNDARDRYKKLADSESSANGQDTRAEHISELIEYIHRYDRGAGMKHTLSRLALSQNFISRDTENGDA